MYNVKNIEAPHSEDIYSNKTSLSTFYQTDLRDFLKTFRFNSIKCGIDLNRKCLSKIIRLLSVRKKNLSTVLLFQALT